MWPTRKYDNCCGSTLGDTYWEENVEQCIVLVFATVGTSERLSHKVVSLLNVFNKPLLKTLRIKLSAKIDWCGSILCSCLPTFMPIASNSLTSVLKGCRCSTRLLKTFHIAVLFSFLCSVLWDRCSLLFQGLLRHGSL